MTEQIDGVVVAGAGPVGLVTALKIAKSGVPVVVLDGREDVIREPRAIVYHPPTVEVLDSLGLLDEIKQIGVVKDDYQYRTCDGEVLAAWDNSALEPEDTAYPYNVHLGQHELTLVVLRHLLELPNAEVRWGHKVVAVYHDADTVEVTVENLAGQAVRIQAPWLVGADGSHSVVRRATGIDYPGFTWPEWLVSTNVRHDFESMGFARSNFLVDPKHWGVVAKISKDGLWRVTYAEEPGLPEDEVRRRVPQRYAEIFGGQCTNEPEIVAPYRVHDRCAAVFRQGRVLLAGDAAHVILPIGGLGLTGGVMDAILLGEALSAVIAGESGEERIQHYAQERRRVYIEFTSPTAREMKRKISETDPARKRADLEWFAKLGVDQDITRRFATATRGLQGNPFRPGGIRASI
ncbi:FAD-dependent oxidoreductase [Mycobacterium colombiense]|uniref:FAD-dependent oxidoreductase n=1 Tax=Mycobacterium colombiense TaxID=339268 RepID=UPI00200AE1CF|nr:FAD-dependent monooxygenase [Mycobacterium colombiense]MCK8647122.1 FAD-dependent monooxygenase [Mycobacterium colombiense]